MTSAQKTAAGWGLVALAAAVGAFFLAREQERIRNLYGDQPQTLTVADLAAHGYGDNVWLDLTEVEFGPKLVVETKNGAVKAAWVPVFPRGQAKKGGPIQVILRTTKARSEAEIGERFRDREKVRGAVINPTLLTPYTPYRTLLQQQYPEVPLAETIWEVDVDYLDKPSPQWATGFYAACAGLGLIGLLCLAWACLRGGAR